MYYYDIGDYEIFFNPRCALSTIREWGIGIRKKGIPSIFDAAPSIFDWPYKMALTTEREKVLVIRNPTERFISILNHVVVFECVNNLDTKARVPLFLDVLEKDGLNFNDHLRLQCRFQDNSELYKVENPSKYFDHILRLEDGNLIERLNTLTGYLSEDIYVNTTQEKIDYPENYFYDYTKMEFITKEDITEEMLQRIKKLYYYDYKHFYPELL